MNDNIRKILFAILIFVLQVVICDYVNLGPYVYICLLPLIFIIIPRSLDVKLLMLIGFGAGILLDLMSDGVVGLNAAASVLSASFTKFFYGIFIGGDRQDTVTIPTPSNAGWARYLKFVSAVVLLYMFVYVIFDGFGYRPFFFLLLRLVASVVANVVLISLISSSILDRD